MLFQFVAFPYMHYRQSYEASKMKGWDLKKWVPVKNKNILKRKSQRNLKTWENNIKTQMASIVCCVYISFWLSLEHKPLVLKLKLAVLYRDEYLRFF